MGISWVFIEFFEIEGVWGGGFIGGRLTRPQLTPYLLITFEYYGKNCGN